MNSAAHADRKETDLGAMPEWDLTALYARPDAPEVATDLARARNDAIAIKTNYQGKLMALAADGGQLALAVKAYEALSDLIGRLGSYAGLLYAANTADPARAKFYGDIQENITAITTDLVFFELELNQIAPSVLTHALRASGTGALQAVV